MDAPTDSTVVSQVSGVGVGLSGAIGEFSGDTKSVVNVDRIDDEGENNDLRELGQTTVPMGHEVLSDGQGLVPIPKKSRLIKTDRPRPFICSICTRGFARQEHLKRHERSHTNEKPFLCAFCGRCFARRDLVLRHQQKLHAALMDQDKNPDLSSASKEVKQNYAERHIIRRPGNKETMLPTPNYQSTNSVSAEKTPTESIMGIGRSHTLMDTASQNSRLNSSQSPKSGSNGSMNVGFETNTTEEAVQQPKRRKRHASFSASTTVSYTQRKDATDLIGEDVNDIPHQVGFSTPQLTAQELVDKALLSGVELESLLAPDLFLSEPSIPINSENLINGTYNAFNSNHDQNGGPASSMHINLDHISKDLHKKHQFAPGLTPLVSDLLTLRSSAAGVGGFVDLNVEPNLDYFNYKDSDQDTKRRKNNDGSLDNSKQQIQPVQNQGESFPSKSPLNSHQDTSKLIHEFINNMEPHGSNTRNSSTTQPRSIVKGATQNQSHSDDEHWLSEFINSELDGNFKVNMSHFNEIGFPATSVSSQFSSNPNSPALNQLGSGQGNIRVHLPTHPQQHAHQVKASPVMMRSVSQTGSINECSPQNTTPLDISSLFKSRQVDLFKKIMDTNGISTPGLSPSSVHYGAKPRRGTKLVFFDEELRQKILAENNLLSTQFPTLKELNSYANLYQYEFHKYFPFIHLHSIRPSMDVYPLLLSICVVGALYGFHSSHAMLLFNISRFHIREYLERTNDKHDKTPLWIIQSMVLLIFLGIFNNDMSITQTMNTQIMSLIELVKLKKLNLPLENIMAPPIESDHILEYQDNPEIQEQIRKKYRTKEQMEKNFQYFIKAQSRIRTCHTILIISNLFTSLVGLDCCFHSIDLKCGIPCYNEQLYFCENSLEWTDMLSNDNFELDSKFSLIQLSNGGETYKNCLIYLTNGHQFFYDNKKVSFKTLLSLLISIHEKIFIERYNLKRETNVQLKEMKWRMNSRPIIESLLKFWEALYLKNGGILQPNESNIQLINANPTLRLIIPLHFFAKMRKCICLTTVMNKIWLKDWQAMNLDLENSFSDWDSLREATDYALNIVKFWIDTVSIVKNAEKTSIRTPIFSITCIFSAILTIAEFLKRMELRAINWTRSQMQQDDSSTFLNYVDRTIWLKSEMILKKVETHLLPKGYSMQSYAEFLRLQANGALDVDVLDDVMAKTAMDPNTDIIHTVEVVRKARLSSRSLYLGVRILGDAPIWPIALLFAHALQSRAVYNVANMNSVGH